MPEKTLAKLRQLEPELRRASRYGKFKEAEQIMTAIQQMFVEDRSHYRVLHAKNWFFQAALEDNNIDYAISGFESVRIRAKENTRTYLEATVLLGVCHLRKKDIEKAKGYIREAILAINNVKSDDRRNQFQKRIIERVELECILGQLSVDSPELLEPEELHREAVKLLKSKTEQEIFELIGSSVPQESLKLLEHVKDYSIKLLPVGDQRLLASPAPLSNITFGRRVVETVKRIGWRSICDPDSQIYTLWKKQIPEVFNKGYFASAIWATCAKFSIGIPIIAIGVVAIVMKYSAEEFCDRFHPQDLMIARSEKG